MLLILLRHAEAVDQATDDAARRLTPKGIEQAARVARYLRRKKLMPDVIVSSPVTRAKETAVLVAEAVECTLVLDPNLRPGMHPALGMETIDAHPEIATLLLVGHEPDLSSLASTLLGSSRPEMLHLRKGSITGIELARPAPGCGELHFLVPVRLMG